MTKFQKLCNLIKFIGVQQYYMFVMSLDDLIDKFPFTNKHSLMVKRAYHLVRLSQTSYAIALILENDEFVAEAKQMLDESMKIWSEI